MISACHDVDLLRKHNAEITRQKKQGLFFLPIQYGLALQAKADFNPIMKMKKFRFARLYLPVIPQKDENWEGRRKVMGPVKIGNMSR